MQIIDRSVMQSMAWLHTRLSWWRDEGYTIDSVVVSDGDVIVVRHKNVTAEMERARDIIVQLLNHLPDSLHPDDESWRWCWDELGGDAQDIVMAARKSANELLSLLRRQST